jgi:hypothetical protein
MKPHIAVGNVVLCDYVGVGSNNKHILVNTFSGDIIAKEFPINLGLGLYVELLPKQPAAPIEDIELSMTIGGEPVISARAGVKMADDAPSVLVITHIQVQVSEPTNLTVKLSSKDYRDTIVMEKKIIPAELD